MQLTAVQLLVCGALRLVKVSRPDVKDRPIDVTGQYHKSIRGHLQTIFSKITSL